MKTETCRPFCEGLYFAITRVNLAGVRIFTVIDSADLSAKVETPDKRAFNAKVQDLISVYEAQKAEKERDASEKAIEEALSR